MVLIINMLRVCLFGEGRSEDVTPTTPRRPAKTGTACSSPPSPPPTFRATVPSDFPVMTDRDTRDTRDTPVRSHQRPHQSSRAALGHREPAPPRQTIAKPIPRRRDTSMGSSKPPRTASGATDTSPTGGPKSQFHRDIVLLQRQYDELCAKMQSFSTKRAQDLQQRPQQRPNQSYFRNHRERTESERAAARTNTAMLTITPQPRETLTPAFSTSDQ